MIKIDFESKLDKAWNLIIDHYDILNEIKKNGVFEITANQIKQYYEPRLMTKFDWSSERPKIFNKHHISVLPNSRGSYILGKFDAYEPLKYSEEKPQSIPMTQWIRSFDSFPITSESLALNVAQMTGMIDIVLDNCNNEVTPHAVSTLTGRLKSGLLDFDINFLGNGKKKYHFNVTNSQIEIDAGFETIDKLAVIEAKNRVPSDFMIRQLYYPYRLFNTLNTGKEVIPIFFTHADDIYSFHIFKFNELKNYSSIEKVKQISFIVDQVLNIEINTVKQISDTSKNITEFPVTFPQADSFSNLMDILQFMDTPKNKYQIADFLGYNERQGDYYGNALRYLGLAKKDNNHLFSASKLGKKIQSLPNSNQRNIVLIRQILRSKAMNLIFKNTLRNGNFDDDYIINVIANSGGIGKSTLKRRKSTARNYISWILQTATAE